MGINNICIALGTLAEHNAMLSRRPRSRVWGPWGTPCSSKIIVKLLQYFDWWRGCLVNREDMIVNRAKLREVGGESFISSCGKTWERRRSRKDLYFHRFESFQNVVLLISVIARFFHLILVISFWTLDQSRFYNNTNCVEHRVWHDERFPLYLS